MTTSANAQQTEFWNTLGGPRWVRLQEDLDRELLPLGEAAMDEVGIARDARVLDVGCGCGGTVLELAGRVGPAGAVLGADISLPMLERARERAAIAGLTNVVLELADAQTHPFPATFDVVYSRFGVMFFADPTAAFTNLGSALRPGGRLGFVCWQPLAKSPVMQLPAIAAAAHLALPESPPAAPGPFAFSDPEHTRSIVASAGFQDIVIAPLEMDVAAGPPDDLDQSVRYLLQFGPAGAALRDAAPDLVARVAADLRAAVVPFVRPEGLLLRAAVWIVTARRG